MNDIQNISAFDFDDWLNEITTKYSQIVDIHLTGSRAAGCAGPHSDYDVVILLASECYDENSRQENKIEQRIAFDENLRHEALDIFWLRPDGFVGRWEHGPEEEPELVGDEYIDTCILNGDLFGDFSRLYKSLPQAKCLYKSGEGE